MVQRASQFRGLSGDDPQDDYLGRACKNGPQSDENRDCTDKWCCIMFLAVFSFMGYIAFMAYKNGNPAKLAHPFETDCKLHPRTFPLY